MTQPRVRERKRERERERDRERETEEVGFAMRQHRCGMRDKVGG